MPQHAPDFSRGFIYCLRAPGASEVYYGSCTTNPDLRWAQHRNHFNRWCAGLDDGRYLRAFDVMLNEGAYLEVLEEFPCDSAEELHRREGEYIKNDPNAVNGCIAGRTVKEYYQLPEVKKRVAAHARARYHAGQKEKKKEYYQKNREVILAKAKALRDAGKASMNQK